MREMSTIKPIESATLRSRAVEQLRGLIVPGELGPGARLIESDLAQALGISRGSLREAMRELIDVGLLVSLPYRGLFVRDVSCVDLEEIYSLRTHLEQFAFRRCWDRRTAAARADLVARHTALMRTIEAGTDPLRAIEDELHLHNWCYELAGHDLLPQSWNRMKPNLQFYFAIHQQADERRGPLRTAHDVYIELACGDDLPDMPDHLVAHMRQGLDTTTGFVRARQSARGGRADQAQGGQLGTAGGRLHRATCQGRTTGESGRWSD